MNGWKKAIVTLNSTLQETMITMDRSGFKFALVIDNYGCLCGVISDGDLRRAILQSVSFTSLATEFMNSQPITASYTTPKSELLNVMRMHRLHHIPLINAERMIVDLVTIDELIGFYERPNWVVLMVGGLGNRLRPLTENCPKPMLQIGNKPILEIILNTFIEQGFRKFYFAVNYLADVIHEYFGDGHSFGVEIKYLNEKERLGTGGALALLPEVPEDDIFVMNGDLLTTIDFGQMLQYHQSHNASATMAVREYDFEVPFGVVKLNNTQIVNIDEKPKHRFFVNAGIYTLSPSCLKYIPKNALFDMPCLFKKLYQIGEPAIAYPLREKWIDIGQMEEFEYAREEWAEISQEEKVML